MINTSFLLLLIACEPNKSPEESIALAKTELENKRCSSAIIDLKNALREHKNNTENSQANIHLLFGQAYLCEGDMPQAERFLSQVIAADFQLTQSLPLYARALFHQDKFKLLQQLIDNNKNISSTIHTELLLYKVLLLHKTGKTQEATEQLSNITEQLEDSVFSLFTQAYIQTKKSPSRALALVEQLQNIDPSYVDGYLLKGQLSFSQKKYNAAYTAFSQYLLRQPKAYHVHFLLALSAYKQNKFNIAKPHVSTLLKINKNQPLANHLQALLFFRDENYSQAKAHAEHSLQFGLKYPVNYLIAGISSLHLKQDEAAYQYLTKASLGMPKNLQVKKVLTLVQLKLGYLQDAIVSFNNIDLSTDAEFSLGNMLAAHLLTQNNNTEARAILAKLQFSPTANPQLKLQQGLLQLKAGDDNGFAILEQLAKQDGSNDLSKMALIIALASSGEIDKALSQAIQWQLDSPNNISAMSILGALYQKNDDFIKAAYWYELVLELSPKNVPSLLFQAKQAADKNNNKRASELFVRILTLKPNHKNAYAALLKIEVESNEKPNWAFLESLIDKSSSDQQVLYMLARAMYKSFNYDLLHQYLIANQDNWSNALWRLWLQLQLNRNDSISFDKALNKFNKLYQDDDNQFFVIALLEKEQKFQIMLDFIDQQPLVNSRVKLQYARVMALLSLKKIAKAEFAISQLKARKTLPALNWLQGQLALLKNNPDSAITFFDAHFSEQPSLQGLAKLVPLVIKSGDIKYGIELGEHYLASFPNDHQGRVLLSQWFTKVDNNAAIRFLDVPQSQLFIEQNWQLANNLAWLYLNGNNKRRALTFSSIATSKQPENKDVSFTHAVALLHHEEKAAALDVLTSIKRPNRQVKQLIERLKNK